MKKWGRSLSLIMALVIAFSGMNLTAMAAEVDNVSVFEEEKNSDILREEDNFVNESSEVEQEEEESIKEPVQETTESNKNIGEDIKQETIPSIQEKEDGPSLSDNEMETTEPDSDKESSVSDNEIEIPVSKDETETTLSGNNIENSVSDNEIEVSVSYNDIKKDNLPEEEKDVMEYQGLLDLKLKPIDVEEEDIYIASEILDIVENGAAFFSQSYELYGDEYTSYYIYNQLDEETKEVWRAMEIVYSDYLGNAADVAKGHVGMWLMKTNGKSLLEMIDLMLLFKYTHPQYYYLSNGIYYNSGYKPGDETVSLGFAVYQKFQNGAVRKQTTEEIETILNTWGVEIAQAGTEEEKIKVIHDKICNKVDYNHGVLEKKPGEEEGTIDETEEEIYFTQSAYSVFCTNLTVCAGYTQAFTWLCNASGIDAIGVTSPGHAWNKVKANGEWYNMDCTWDDGTGVGNRRYHYYLRSDYAYDNDAQVDYRASHQEEWMWVNYLPPCVLDSGSGYSPGTLPIVSKRATAPEIYALWENGICTVTMTTETEGAKIYYTLDETTPSEAYSKSFLYKTPLTFTEVKKIKAIAVAGECLDSEVEQMQIAATSGSCGANISWDLDARGCLTLTGTGNMTVFSAKNQVPWFSHRNSIKEVIIERGITDISAYAFSDYANLNKITIPRTVTTIQPDAISAHTSIVGFPGSTAENYANTYGNTFIDISPYVFKIEFVTGTEDIIEPWYADNGEFIFEPEAITKPGYNFTGWYLSPEPENQIVAWDFTKDTVTESITLYAGWTPATYLISFDANGGSVEENQKEVVYESIYGELPLPRKYGMIFLGWYTEPEAGDLVDADTKVQITDHQTLYAHWKLKYTAEVPYTDIPTGEEVKEGSFVELNSPTNGAQIYYILLYKTGMDTTAMGNEGVLDADTTTLLTGKEDADRTERINTVVEQGFRYEAPIKITEEVTIYAVATKPEYENSDIVEVSYFIKDQSDDWEDLGNYAEDLAEAKTRFETESATEIPEQLWIAGLEDFVYTGKAITQPDFRVYFQKTLLQKGVDYTVKYSKNTNAGTAEIKITGKGNYGGNVTEYFEILPLDLNQAQLSAQTVYLPYNGKVQKATIKLTYDRNGQKVTLKQGTDYVCDYPGSENGSAFVEPREYEVTITGMGNYAGNKTFTQVITESYLIEKVSLNKIPNQKYDNGNFIEPDPVLKNGNVPLIKDVDYTVEYHNNQNAGTATAIITGIGEYAGSRSVEFKIVGTAINKVKLSGYKSSLTYEKDEQGIPVPAVQTVSFTHTTGSGANRITRNLEEGTDYTVSYTNNDKVGTATVIYTGIGGYTGTLKKTFKVVGQSISKAKINGFETTMAYDCESMEQKNCQLSIANSDGSQVLLEKDKDYTVSYQNQQKAGKATMTIRGINGYNGTIKKTYRIDPINIKTAYESGKIEIVGMQESYPYEKSGVKPKPVVVYTNSRGESVTLKEGKDYSLKYSNYKVVTSSQTMNLPTVTIAGKGNYSSSFTRTFSIDVADIRQAEMKVPNLVYRKKANIFKQKVALYDNGGKLLSAGRDYEKTVTYEYAKDTVVTIVENRREKSVIRLEGEVVETTDILPVGAEIKVTVRGMNNFAQNKSVIFRVIATDIAKARVKIDAQTYKGRPVKLTKEDITVYIGNQVLKSTEYDIIGFSNNHKVGTAKVTIAGRGDYGGEKTVTFKIKKIN